MEYNGRWYNGYHNVGTCGLDDDAQQMLRRALALSHERLRVLLSCHVSNCGRDYVAIAINFSERKRGRKNEGYNLDPKNNEDWITDTGHCKDALKDYLRHSKSTQEKTKR
ncbi:hypothetical protein PROFUN_14163 [Planoprotostelium fungivorum]|uniref:Uncharacterized protein n=1 Tax=Planoprotostelium fungivorum TaxID=1890364 RepID=A0A2P6N199_9EUKA|nr:hypothetical protein PROFUN_14163 [Planoprotostelium fungivorum]